MAEVIYSKLTQEILSRADDIRKEQGGQYLIIEFLLLAALDYVVDNKGADSNDEETSLKRTILEYLKQDNSVRKNIMRGATEKGNSVSGSLLFQRSMYSAKNKGSMQNRGGVIV